MADGLSYEKARLGSRCCSSERRAPEDPKVRKRINTDGVHEKEGPEKITVHTTPDVAKATTAESDVTTSRQRRACFVCTDRLGNGDLDDLNESPRCRGAGGFRFITQYLEAENFRALPVKIGRSITQHQTPRSTFSAYS